MRNSRASLETEFLRICCARGPQWIESVIRPLRLQGTFVTVRDIPTHVLAMIIRLFGSLQQPVSGV